MRPNAQFPADLITFTEEIINGKLNFMLCESCWKGYYCYNLIINCKDIHRGSKARLL